MGKIKIAGLDLSITATGIADIHGFTSTVGGDARQGDKRLCKIRAAVEAEILAADLIILEDLPRSGMGGATTGMVQGVVRERLVAHDVPYILVPPSTLKMYATGNGGSAKPELRMSLYKRFGYDIADDNQVDAWWLRALGHDLYDQPIHQSNGNLYLPESHRRALNKLTKIPVKGMS